MAPPTAGTGWWRLPSGAVFQSPRRPHPRAVPTDPEGQVAPDISAEGLRAVLADTLVKVHDAIAAGNRRGPNGSSYLLRHAVHLGVDETDLLLGFCNRFGDQHVETGESGGPVGADDPGVDLPPDTPEIGESPPVGDGPTGDDEGDVVGQATKPKSRSRPRSS